MDSVRAKRMTAELLGKQVGGWTILEFKDHGKSALVFKAEREGEIGAIKVFDPELVERFGRDKQLERINRETALIGKHHPHLIEIKDGGACDKTGYLFVVMAFLPHKNLAQVLKEVPQGLEFQIISQVASAAEFLEQLGLAHRDIKPENIVVSDDFNHCTLLDLGVLRPIGLSAITDHEEQKTFIGTLQYSPPELLYRDEVDNIDGWRAVTFYQLGAVLHDLIMKRQIFADYVHPFAKLVDAVRDVPPRIDAPNTEGRLQWLGRSCLLKKPEKRLELVKWTDFLVTPKAYPTLQELSKEIQKKQTVLRSQMTQNESAGIQQEELKTEYRMHEILNDVDLALRHTCTSDRDCFPRFEVSEVHCASAYKRKILLHFEPSLKHGLNIPVEILLCIVLTPSEEDIIRLFFKVFAISGTQNPDNMDVTGVKLLFAGPYVRNTVIDKLARLLYAVMDKILDMESTLSKEFITERTNDGCGPINLDVNLDGLDGGSG